MKHTDPSILIKGIFLWSICYPKDKLFLLLTAAVVRLKKTGKQVQVPQQPDISEQGITFFVTQKWQAKLFSWGQCNVKESWTHQEGEAFVAAEAAEAW